MTCDMECSIDGGMYHCVCSRCGQALSVARLPVYASCGLQRRHSPAKVRPLPGTALKSLLAGVGITAAPGCSCNARAAEMDARGCDWVEANEDTVVGWLREEAAKRGLPFLEAAGRMLVRLAVRRARASSRTAQSAAATATPSAEPR